MERAAASRRFAVLWLALLILAALPADAARTVRVASGFERPVYIGQAPGDHARMFVAEQWTGRIRVLRDGAILPRPFLDLGRSVGINGEERGLLGLAFHPDFARNGHFYVNYTRSGDGATVISRFRVSPDADSADAASEAILLTVPQPYSNHNGGGIEFGPDGYLYIGMGDGGGANDPENRAQDEQELLGKMLRLHVNGGTPYRVPDDNPLVDTNGRDEIWAKGLRNPWRFSFDRETGDLYIADVGQDRWEEINVQPAGSKGGLNYGWRCMEGNGCTGFAGCKCNSPALEKPVHQYSHRDGCSITGGYVYRGCAIPDLRGTYFFADYCSNRIWSFRYRGGGITDFVERTQELKPQNGYSFRSISGFGQDHYGELYILSHMNGEVFKLVPDELEDCNRNFVLDRCEIVTGQAADRNHNGIPDACEEDGALQVPYPLFRDGHNPFLPRYAIDVELERDTLVDVTVFRVRDSDLVVLLRDSLRAGQHTITFDAAGHPPGVYIGQVTTNGTVTREKLLHLK